MATANYLLIATSTSLQIQVAFVFKYNMEEPNSNRVRRRGHRLPTGERQGLLSESQLRQRERDRRRRRRDDSRRVPTSAAYSPVSPISRRLGNHSENDIMGNSAPVSSPAFFPASPSFYPMSPIWAVDHDSGSGMRQNLPLAPSPPYSPAYSSFRPVSPTPWSVGADLEELIPVHFPKH